MTTVIHRDPPDILGAVNDFVLERARPALGQERIVRGWGNRTSLPDGVDCAVLTLRGISRRGTNVRLPAPGEGLTGVETAARLAVCETRIDFCGSDQGVCAARADALELLSRDPSGVAFFRRYGLGCLYAEPIRERAIQDETGQWEIRASLTLFLSYWSGADLPVDFFDAVTADAALTGRPETYLENVDTHHPPAGERA